MEEDKLDHLMQHLIGKTVIECRIENDAFLLVFDDDTLMELYSENGDLDLYYEFGQESPALH